MKAGIAFLVTVLLCASAAWADIHLEWTQEDLGGGLYAYEFVIRNDDGLMQSYAATVGFEIAGEATRINQVGNHDDDDDGDFLIGWPGDDWTLDSYSRMPFRASGSIPGNSLLNGDTFSGYREALTYFEFSVGTGAGSQHGDNTPLAHIVADGDVHWVGTIARGTGVHTVEGYTPEPATLAMLGLGAAALLRRRSAQTLKRRR